MIMIIITILFTNFSFCGFYWKQKSGLSTAYKKNDWLNDANIARRHRVAFAPIS
jgi:hypothetical protein